MKRPPTFQANDIECRSRSFDHVMATPERLAQLIEDFAGVKVFVFRRLLISSEVLKCRVNRLIIVLTNCVKEFGEPFILNDLLPRFLISPKSPDERVNRVVRCQATIEVF